MSSGLPPLSELYMDTFEWTRQSRTRFAFQHVDTVPSRKSTMSSILLRLALSRSCLISTVVCARDVAAAWSTAQVALGCSQSGVADAVLETR